MRSIDTFSVPPSRRRPAALRAEDAGALLRQMIRLLPSEQRQLAQMVILNRQSHREAARALRQVPGAVSRRVKALRNRLACPVRRALALHLDTLPPAMRGIAIDFYFGGASQRAIARSQGLPASEIRAQIEYLTGWIRALHRRRLAERRAVWEQLQNSVSDLDAPPARACPSSECDHADPRVAQVAARVSPTEERAVVRQAADADA